MGDRAMAPQTLPVRIHVELLNLMNSRDHCPLRAGGTSAYKRKFENLQLTQPMDPEKKSLNFIFPTKYVIPKSLKFSIG